MKCRSRASGLDSVERGALQLRSAIVGYQHSHSRLRPRKTWSVERRDRLSGVRRLQISRSGGGIFSWLPMSMRDPFISWRLGEYVPRVARLSFTRSANTMKPAKNTDQN